MKILRKLKASLPSFTYYMYNEETCGYEAVSLRKIILGSGMIIGIIIYALTQTFFTTPKERILLNKNAVLTEQRFEDQKVIKQMALEVNNLLDINTDIFNRLNITVDPERYAIEDDAYIPEVDIKPDSIYASIETKRKKMLATRSNVLNKLENVDYMPSVCPVDSSAFNTPNSPAKYASPFGMRYHPVYKRKKMHTGLDISVRVGAKVNSAAKGIIKEVGWQAGYGNYIIIAHSEDLSNYVYETKYCHLSGVVRNLKIGTRVKKRQHIGFSGNSGLTTGPHLHYEVIKNGQFVDPLDYLFEEDVNKIRERIKNAPLILHH
jgi:murein DD-endopeptidase MepM/ murein hydrolase activator NlpD